MRKPDALEPFHLGPPRIFGMGDVLFFIEDIESKVDRAQAEKLATKLKKGTASRPERLPFEQLKQMKTWAVWPV